jgi:hypothetical protein
MTDDEIMRQLSQARDDDVLAAEEMVTTGQEQHPEWDWPFPPTARRFTRQELKRDLPGSSDHCPSVLAEHPAAWVALPSCPTAKSGVRRLQVELARCQGTARTP